MPAWITDEDGDGADDDGGIHGDDDERLALLSLMCCVLCMLACSAGMVLLQMAFPRLRNDDNLIAFNKALKDKHGHDLRAWRVSLKPGSPSLFASWTDKKDASSTALRDFQEGFDVLDLDGGAGWDLLCRYCCLLCAEITDYSSCCFRIYKLQ